MNITNLFLNLNNISVLFNVETLNCLSYIVDRYFSMKTLYLLFADDFYLNKMLSVRSVYTVTDPNEWNSSSLSFMADSISFGMINHHKLIGLRGKSILVVRNISALLPIYKQYKLMPAIAIVPVYQGCEIFTFSWNTSYVSYIDSWVSGAMLHNKNLFPCKVPGDLKGFSLHVTAVECPPAVINSSEEAFEGPATKLLQTMASSLGLTIINVPMAKSDFYRSRDKTGAPDGFLKKLSSGETDLAYCCLKMTYDRVRFSDPLLMYQEGFLVWTVRAPQPLPFSGAIFSGFSGLIWTLVLLAVLCFSGILFLQKDCSPLECFFKPLSIALGIPTSPLFSMMPLWYLFQVYSLHVIWFYQSTLLDQLMNRPYEKPIKTAQEALDLGLRVVFKPLYASVVKRSQLWTQFKSADRHLETNDIDYRRVSEYGDTMVFGSRMVAEVMFRQIYEGKRLESKVRFLKEKFEITHNTFFMTKNHPLIPKLYNKMEMIVEGGLYDVWFQETMRSYSRRVHETYDEYESLGFKNLVSLFWVYGFSLLLSLVLFVSEFCYFHKSKARKLSFLK